MNFDFDSELASEEWLTEVLTRNGYLETGEVSKVVQQKADLDGGASIGESLGIAATESTPIDPNSRYRARRETNYWGWCSKVSLHSTDNLQHVEAICELLAGKRTELSDLREMGCEIDVFCYWVFSEQGGHQLDAPTMSKLAALELDIGWDIYSGDEHEYTQAE